MSSEPEEIKARLPVEEVIGSYLPLKRAGRVFKGLCPFHQEKTPSFTVNPERGIFKCFGCGEGGDIFDFVMKMDGLTFPEAVTLLAERAGVTLEKWQPPQQSTQPSGPPKQRLFELNRYTASVWHAILTRHPKAEPARQYLAKRGLLPATIDQFQIGYAPYGSATLQTLQKAGFTAAEIRASGDPGKFQDRIVFPIADLTGKVVGFTGRILEAADDTHKPGPTPPRAAPQGPKYWNTPETPVFVKSRAVYALHLAKHAIQDRQVAILAEGQMDVIMLHQFGYTHTVASSGTALTIEQLRLIRRFAPAIAFAYDGDRAGVEATKRGLELALAAEFTAYVIPMPGGKDPAECLQKDPAAWEQAYQNRLPALDWLAHTLIPEAGASTLSAEVKKRVARELVEWLARVPDPTEQADWFRTFAAYLQTNEENLRTLYRRLKPNQALAAATPQAAAPAAPTPNQVGRLAETVFALVTTLPEVYPLVSDQIKNLPAAARQSPSGQTLLPLLENEPSLEAVLNRLSDAERTKLALASEDALQSYEGIDLTPTWAIGELTLLLRRLRDLDREQTKARIAEAIQRAQTLGDSEQIKNLFQELQNLV